MKDYMINQCGYRIFHQNFNSNRDKDMDRSGWDMSCLEWEWSDDSWKGNFHWVGFDGDSDIEISSLKIMFIE